MNNDYLLDCCGAFLKLARLEFDPEAFSKLMGAVKQYGGESKWRLGVREFVKAVGKRLNNKE